MKLLTLFLSTILISTISFSKDLKTNIDSITIFTTDAQINRSRYVDLKKGENILFFKHLETEIQTNSIQIFGANNNKNITVVSSHFSTEQIFVPGIKVAIKLINDSLQTISQDIGLLNARIQNLNQEKALVLSHSKITYHKEVDYVNLVESMMAYYRQSTLKIDKMIIKLQKDKSEKEILKLNLEKRHQQKLDPKYDGVVKTKIYAKEATKQKLHLNYLVSGVSWTPFYDIKSTGISDPLVVSCKATILQNTGVDWKNVPLTLSTRKQTSLTTIPKIHPWVLHFQNSYKRYSQNNLIINQRAISNSHIPVQKSVPTNQNVSNTSQYLNTFKSATHKMINKEYRSKRNHTISGNDGAAVMELDNFKMKTKYKYYSVPKYDQNVYLIAEINRHEQYDLIPAFANIFLEGMYVGKLFINPETVNSKLDLMLGKDSDIIVDRRKVNQAEEKQRRIIGNIEKTTIEIELIVKNRKSNAVNIIIKDQVPISGQEGIAVDVLKISGAVQDSTNGTLTWRKELSPLKSQKFVMKYEIARPKNKKIANF